MQRLGPEVYAHQYECNKAKRNELVRLQKSRIEEEDKLFAEVGRIKAMAEDEWKPTDYRTMIKFKKNKKKDGKLPKATITNLPALRLQWNAVKDRPSPVKGAAAAAAAEIPEIPNMPALQLGDESVTVGATTTQGGFGVNELDIGTMEVI